MARIDRLSAYLGFITFCGLKSTFATSVWVKMVRHDRYIEGTEIHRVDFAAGW